jgi:hypothetical protein
VLHRRFGEGLKAIDAVARAFDSPVFRARRERCDRRPAPLYGRALRATRLAPA